MKKLRLLKLSMIIIVSSSFAQNQLDALRYSQNNIFGSARFSAMGGAFGALGGEFSSLSHNPAGVSMYQFNELTFTPSFAVNNTTSYSDIADNNDYKINLNINSLGLVYTLPKKDSEWKRTNIAIGWNQLASYDRSFILIRKNTSSSLADKILDLAQGNLINDLDNFFTSPAFWTDLIDLEDNSTDSNVYLYDNGNYISHVNGESNKTQMKSFRSEGNQNEVIFSFGSSYREKLYLGATIGFPSINYKESTEYTESSFEDTINGLSSFTLKEDLIVYGNGVNIKIGGLMRISENIKLGGAVHSPTFFNMEETYSTNLTTFFSNPNREYSERSPYNFFTYNLITPWKAIMSGSVVYNQSIIISGDYEIVDYSFARMESENYLQWTDENNQNIQDSYIQTTNLRIGGEMNFKPFIFRAGYSFFGSPYANKDFSRENYSVGLGINNGNYYFDVAYVVSETKDEHILYNYNGNVSNNLKHEDYNLFFTLGFRY